MQIHCTRKLLDQFKIEPESQVRDESPFSWYANLITLNGRKTMVLMNDKNRYVIVFYGLKVEHFKKLDHIILEGIREIFREENIKDEIIEQCINRSKEISYTTTEDRSLVARLSYSCKTVHLFEDMLMDDSVLQIGLSMKVSRYIVPGEGGAYIYPNKELYKDLEDLFGRPIFNTEAVELKITLDLETQSAWRRLVVPLNTNFEKLHEILQIAFSWHGYHLHDFYVYDDKKSWDELYSGHLGYHKEGYLPIVNLVCDEEAFLFDNMVSMRLETGVKLSEYIPVYKNLIYNYDFGDGWQHYIVVEKIRDDYIFNYPMCIGGEGNAPPEDVGGKYGFQKFLEIIDDEGHPEHQTAMDWGMEQGYEDFDIEKINRKLH